MMSRMSRACASVFDPDAGAGMIKALELLLAMPVESDPRPNVHSH